MPSTLIAPPFEFENLPRKKWTRDECAQLSGLFDLHQYELINGELIKKMGKNHPHVWTLLLLAKWLQSVFPAFTIVTEAPIDVRPEDNPASDPEPDAVVLTKPYNELAPRPKSTDVRLVAEVSDTTLAFDLSAKAALYARAEIPEYWVLDVTSRRLVVHRSPQAGAYQDIRVYADSESLAPLAAPDSTLLVAGLF
ncbi:MAG: Uma2 family endonuclease [Bryobacteraceae bacterium]|nr:Uma2 family endonuclease [Bryobacteraceae bacterium]